MFATGYHHEAYAASLAEFGQSIRLPGCGGWLLRRAIPGAPDCDAMGCYPLFCCADWGALSGDLKKIDDDLVSLVFVTDPFAEMEPSLLAPTFSHGLTAFKLHTVIDLQRPMGDGVSAHHRRNARQALRQVSVERLTKPADYLDDWCDLYGELIARHAITGVARFSRLAFATQLAVPGVVAFRAVADGETIGMMLWYTHGDVAFYHLAAYSPRGYELKSSFALLWTALEAFRGSLRWLSLGGAAGVKHDPSDGLARFKSGWSPLTRPTYLARHVFLPERYAELCRGRGMTDFFPAYRATIDPKMERHHACPGGSGQESHSLTT
jgi:hypothetical protein